MHPARPEADRPHRERALHVLLVDDNRAIVDILSAILQSAGYSVDTATTGEEAVDIFARTRPAAVLLDLHMPSTMGGPETFAEFRRIDDTVPIIILTGDAQGPRARELLRAGAFDCIQKPIAIDRLKEAVDTAMAGTPANAVPRKAPPTVELAGVRILVVDDTQDSLELMSFVLEGCGATVVRAQSADEALDIVHRDPIDVLVSDLAMPEHDGFWLVEQLRHRKKPRSLVAIAVSGVVRDARKRVLDAGFDDFLQKPFEPSELCRRVAYLVAA